MKEQVKNAYILYHEADGLVWKMRLWNREKYMNHALFSSLCLRESHVKEVKQYESCA